MSLDEKIPHLEARRVLAAHFDDREGESESRYAMTKDVRARIRVVEEKYRELEREELAPLIAEKEAIEKTFDDREMERWDGLEKRLEALGVDFDDFDLFEDCCDVRRCAVTGLALMNDDKVGQTPDGDAFLWVEAPVST